ncbi:LuxR C-terminal-related transcriptional regulator [Streptomyces sp. MnatMP-M17]|uniref:helix-turn-helix transcriptional regulator n=1 Tax=unclassified Streptomyces TaxID=2593676 RepID=UPI00081DC262|nr:LuxR C-terminal-related transcriptional regulator [Streptomyces sp. MnatMP-M17]SCF99852.1 DNA-binding response regulator, NarL/FixJ family, contains REC and HTH domains [Streptomyces sp. MnatMP-M17]
MSAPTVAAPPLTSELRLLLRGIPAPDAPGPLPLPLPLHRDRLRVYLCAPGPALGEPVAAALRRAGIERAPAPSPEVVLVAAARTVDEALDAGPALDRPGGRRLLVVADTFTAAGVLRGVRAGALAMLQSSEASPARLAAGVRSAYHGEGRLPSGVLVRLLSGGAEQYAPEPGDPVAVPPLTARQTRVLALVAEGHGNAAIARSLACSQHTVKNVIYDLMARLQVRTRAHAVAYGVRTGLI